MTESGHSVGRVFGVPAGEPAFLLPWGRPPARPLGLAGSFPPSTSAVHHPPAGLWAGSPPLWSAGLPLRRCLLYGVFPRLPTLPRSEILQTRRTQPPGPRGVLHGLGLGVDLFPTGEQTPVPGPGLRADFLGPHHAPRSVHPSQGGVQELRPQSPPLRNALPSPGPSPGTAWPGEQPGRRILRVRSVAD